MIDPTRLHHVFVASALAVLALLASTACCADHSPPNIVWIISEDMGADLGCWGVDVRTPNIDRLAKEGMRFTKVFGTASVCMPNRTAMITGVTQTTIGAVSMVPPEKYMRKLEGGVKPLPTLLRDQCDYFTGNIRNKQIGSVGKDHWNFRFEGKGWDTDKLSDLASGKPFYIQFNFREAHRPFDNDVEYPVNPATVDLPPCYPDHPVTRRSWADYLESIQHLDRNVGKVLDWLEEKQLADRTIVFFYSDNGPPFLRGKYFLYDHSLNQPLIIRWPEACDPPSRYQAGGVSDQLLAAIDITAQTVVCAGGEVPQWMHGRSFLGDEDIPREEVISAADWYGDSKLKSRSIRTERYKYIRNFNQDLSVLSASTEYRRGMHPLYSLVQILDERGDLSPLHKKLLLDPLPAEELYDLQSDPDELNNLADEPQVAHLKTSFRNQLDAWIRDSHDIGFEEKDPEHVKFFDEYREKNHLFYDPKRIQLRDQILQSMPSKGQE